MCALADVVAARTRRGEGGLDGVPVHQPGRAHPCSARPSSARNTARSLSAGPPGNRAVRPASVSHLVERAAGDADAQRRHLVGQEHVRFLAEQRAAPAGARGPLEGHLRRDEDVVQAEVEAAGPLQARPRASCRRPASPWARRRRAADRRSRAARHPEAADQPVGLRDPAGEAPAAADDVAARHRPARAARARRADDERQRAAGREHTALPRRPAASRPPSRVPPFPTITVHAVAVSAYASSSITSQKSSGASGVPPSSAGVFSQNDAHGPQRRDCLARQRPQSLSACSPAASNSADGAG